MAETTETSGHLSLTQAERDQISKELGKRIPVPQKCEVCLAADKWQLGDRLVSPTPLTRPADGGWALWFGESQILPSITLLCTNCGNTKFLNVLILGLEPPPAKEGGGDA